MTRQIDSKNPEFCSKFPTKIQPNFRGLKIPVKKDQRDSFPLIGIINPA